MSSKKLVVAIDGPAGAGKSTVAKLVARSLGISYLDTGAMYRTLGLKAMRSGLSRDDGAAAAELMKTTEISVGQGDPMPIFLDGEDVTAAIRTQEIGDWASRLSVNGGVREQMVARQQQIIEAGGYVLEGRDTTTRIAVHADLKIFMTASLEERARRRQLELQKKGHPADFETIRKEIEERDHRDITRGESPLQVAPDAQVVETAGKTPEEVVTAILELAQSL